MCNLSPSRVACNFWFRENDSWVLWWQLAASAGEPCSYCYSVPRPAVDKVSFSHGCSFSFFLSSAVVLSGCICCVLACKVFLNPSLQFLVPGNSFLGFFFWANWFWIPGPSRCVTLSPSRVACNSWFRENDSWGFGQTAFGFEGPPRVVAAPASVGRGPV